MSRLKQIIEPSRRSESRNVTPLARRVRFVSALPAGQQSIADFADPVTAHAISEPLDLAIAVATSSEQPTDYLDVLTISTSADKSPLAADWLKTPDSADAPLPVSITLDDQTIGWRPGRAMIEDGPLDEASMRALVEFSFYEAQLRRLEQSLPAHEKAAAAAIDHVYEIDAKAMNHSVGFKREMEALARIRLTFARLEPRLLTPARSLPATARRLYSRLARRAAIEDRLSAVTDRSEACEDLYEGAVDRMTDHRWYRRSHLLEITIVILLAVEVFQLSADMIIRWIHR